MTSLDDLSGKLAPSEENISVEVNEIQEALDGYALDPASYPDNAAGLKTTADGKIVLIPQPSDSPDDPLNWSSRKKMMFLVIIAYIAALADYTGGTAIITIIPQSFEWHMTPGEVQRAVVGNIFAIGACGLFVVALANYFGRLPITLLFQAVFLATTAWSAAATTFNSYFAARIVNGFFCSVGQGGALMWIKDLWFFHEHPRVINYMEFGIITSPYLGPLITAFITSKVAWPWAFWVCTILAGIAFVTVFFLDETLYDRSVPQSKRAPRGTYIERLTGVAQSRSFQQRSLTQSLLRPVIAISKLPVFFVLAYYFLNFAWVIGVNTTVSIWLSEFYHFTPRDIGYFYFFGIIGPLIGWVLGHFMHDAVGRWYARRHNGVIDPEARLLIAYPATLLLFVAVLLLGFGLDRHWHYGALAVICGVQTVGVMIVTTAINAYLLDAYPEGSGEVGAWVTAARNWSGFMATYIQLAWVGRSGLVGAFGAQAGITVASLGFLIVLQIWGKSIRRWQGRMEFGHRTS